MLPYQKYLRQSSSSLAGLFLFSLLWLVWLLAPALMVNQALPLGFIVLALCNIIAIERSRNYLVLIDLISPIAVLMLWTMPALQYRIEQSQGNFDGILMQVDAATYFSIAIPGVLSIGLASYLPLFISKKEDRELMEGALSWLRQHPTALLLLTVTGLLCLLFGSNLPPLLRFPGYLGKTMLYIPGIYLFLQPAIRYRYIWLSLIGAFLFLDALHTTMFGDLAAWIMVLFLYKIVQERWAISKVLMSQVVSILLLFWLISFKYDYREQMALTPHFSDQVTAFANLAVAHIKEPFVWGAVEDVVARLNQGANMSLAFRYVPAMQPFVQGETIVTAMKGALVPRLLWPDKPMAGGVENMRRFMGIENLGYSINLGIVGESYINFGKGYRFVFFLLGYVLIFRAWYECLLRFSRRYPMLILFIPVVFLPYIFVEMDLSIVLNHVVKSSVVILLFVWLLDRYFTMIKVI